jgi:hypothetical protein
MFDITLKVNEERILRKNIASTVTLTYLGLSEDLQNLQFSVYHRKGLVRITETLEVPIAGLEEKIDLGVPPYKVLVTEYNENSVECYIDGMLVVVTTHRYN